jgi:hypothetical protein
MKKVVFVGCSFTAGTGWLDVDYNVKENLWIECKDHPKLWTNLCCTQIDQLKNLQAVNVGKCGLSNSEIFIATTKAITNYNSDIDTIFCQWTGMPRYFFSVGFELWSTGQGLHPNQRSGGVNLSCGHSWDKEYLNDLLDRLLVLHHLHDEILKVVTYCNTLQKLSNLFGIKLYFINGLCPWDQDYFVRLTDVMPEQFTAFTKKEILNIDSRNDADSFQLYKKMHDDYDSAGGIDPKQWVNLYSSMEQQKIDTNYDYSHPGIKSNQLYFKQVKQFLDNQ